jgi:N-acetylmuramoyl-L-alanine amidase
MNLTRVLTVVIIAAAAFAVVGCEEPAAQSQYTIAPEKLYRVHEVADRLGMKIDKSTSAVARLSTSAHGSRVTIYSEPDGRVLFNDTEIARSINIFPDGDELLIPYKIEKEIREKLRFSGEPAFAAAKRDARNAAMPPRPAPMSRYQKPAPKWISSGQLVVIDAGHGGKDPGAIGSNGTREKDVVLDIAMVVAAKLRDKGHNVKMTRAGDVFIPLDGRVEIAEQADPAIFVSIHADAAENRSADGMTIYVPKRGDDSNMSLRAGKLVEGQATAVVDNMKGVRKHSVNLRVLEKTSCPAMLVEVGFVSNPEEEDKLNNSTYRRKIADSIAVGLDKYLKSINR